MTSTWDESLETGNELIDSQHHDLIDLLDRLIDMADGPKNDTLKVLDDVMAFTLFHFVAEEDLMESVDYPPEAKQEMCAQHQEFKSYARLRVIEFRRGDVVNVLPLATFVEDFLKVHEFGLDRQLATWIRIRNGEAAKS